MEFITKTNDREYYFHTLDKGMPDLSLFSTKEFISLLYFDSEDFALDKMQILIDQLLSFNVRYIVCAGNVSEKVHDLIDKIVYQNQWDEKRGEPIMTTWHNDESIDDIMHYFLYCVFPEKSKPEFGLLLFPNSDHRAQMYLQYLKQNIGGHTRGLDIDIFPGTENSGGQNT